jgi:hypothetical protein
LPYRSNYPLRGIKATTFEGVHKCNVRDLIACQAGLETSDWKIRNQSDDLPSCLGSRRFDYALVPL